MKNFMREDAMKAIVFIAVALAIFAPSLVFAEDLGALRVTLIEGEAYIQAEDSDEWFEASVNMPLKGEDSLWVPEGGRLEIHVRGGAFVRLDERTALGVLEAEEGPPRFYLEEGRLYLSNEGTGDETMTVDTPLASVQVPDEAVAMVEVSGSGGTKVSVLEGRAYAETRKGTTVVEAGTYLRTDDGLYATVSRLPAPDEWERWNRARDDDLSGPYASVRYLPDELDEYAYDFDENGRWVYVRDYGHVWTPAVAVSVGWAPYRHGRWRWVHGNYVWVSYERWGWVPYHYGRWAYVTRIGWCWVPPRHREVYWAPGYVAWTYTPTYVAWVPLAPGEIYYAYGYYGPRSVNILSINISKTVVHVHKNIRVHNAVTVVHRDSFRKGGKYSHVKLRRDFFLKNRKWGIHGPPDIKPERPHASGVAKNLRRDGRPAGEVDRPARERVERRRGPAVSKEPFELGTNRQRQDLRAEKRQARKPERSNAPGVAKNLRRDGQSAGKVDRPARERVERRPGPAVSRERYEPRRDRLEARAGRPQAPERELDRKSLRPQKDNRDVRTRKPEVPEAALRGKSSRPETKAKRTDRDGGFNTLEKRPQRETLVREKAPGRLRTTREFEAQAKPLRKEPQGVRRGSPVREPRREARAEARPRARDLKSRSPGRKVISGGRSSPPSVKPSAPARREAQKRVTRGNQIRKSEEQPKETFRKSLPGWTSGGARGKNAGTSLRNNRGSRHQVGR